MRCPWCGNTVAIRNHRWECDFCGGFGDLKPRRNREMAAAAELEQLRREGLPEAWDNLKAAFSKALPDRWEPLLPDLAAAAALEISGALTEAETVTEESRYQVQQFLGEVPPAYELPDLEELVVPSGWKLERCRDKGILTQAVCGSFWKNFYSGSGAESYPEGMDEIFENLGLIRQYLGGQACSARKAALWDGFEYHWNYQKYFHPDADAAVKRLQQDDISRFEDDCRDILVAAYPSYFQNFSLEDLEQPWDFLVRNCLYRDPMLAVEMWKTILNAAGADVWENPRVVRKLREASLFPEGIWKYYFGQSPEKTIRRIVRKLD